MLTSLSGTKYVLDEHEEACKFRQIWSILYIIGDNHITAKLKVWVVRTNFYEVIVLTSKTGINYAIEMFEDLSGYGLFGIPSMTMPYCSYPTNWGGGGGGGFDKISYCVNELIWQ